MQTTAPQLLNLITKKNKIEVISLKLFFDRGDFVVFIEYIDKKIK